MSNKLSAQQQKFADGILSGMSQRDAYVAAGYKSDSERAVDANASRMMSLDKVAAYIDEHRAKASQSAQITQERILQEYARIGFSDLRRVLTPSGNLVDPTEWDDDTAAAISSLEVVTQSGGGGDKPVEYVHKIKTWDKTKALDAMAKHLGMFEGKKGVEDSDAGESLEELNLRALGRRLVHVLNGATEALDEPAG